MSKMTAEELAAYSKVQLLLEKIAKPQIKTEFPLIPNANARAPTQPMQAPSAKPYPSPLHNINAPLKRQPNTYRPQQVQPNTQQFYQRRQQPQRIPPKYTSSPHVHIKQKSSYKIPPTSNFPYPQRPIGPFSNNPSKVMLPVNSKNPKLDPSKMSASEIADFLGKLSGKEVEKRVKENDKVNEIQEEELNEEEVSVKVSDTYHRTLLGDYTFPDQAFKGFGSIKNEFEKDFLETIYEKPIEEINTEKEKEKEYAESFSENERVFVQDPSPDFFQSETELVKGDIKALRDDLKSLKDGLEELSKKSDGNDNVNKGGLFYFIRLMLNVSKNLF